MGAEGQWVYGENPGQGVGLYGSCGYNACFRPLLAKEDFNEYRFVNRQYSPGGAEAY